MTVGEVDGLALAGQAIADTHQAKHRPGNYQQAKTKKRKTRKTHTAVATRRATIPSGSSTLYGCWPSFGAAAPSSYGFVAYKSAAGCEAPHHFG